MRMTKPQTAECILTGLRQQILCFCAVRSATATYTSLTQALYNPRTVEVCKNGRPCDKSGLDARRKSRAEQSMCSQFEGSLQSSAAGRILHVRLKDL